MTNTKTTSSESTLYTEEYCNQAIRTLFTEAHTEPKLEGLIQIDLLVMAHLISRLPVHEISTISNFDMAEQLLCDRRTIASSYARLKKKGLIDIVKSLSRSTPDKGHKIVARQPASIRVRFENFPKGVTVHNPISEDAVDFIEQYHTWQTRISTHRAFKVALYNVKRMRSKLGRAREEIAAQKLINILGAEPAADLINYAISTRSKAALSSMYEIYRQRKSLQAKMDAAASAEMVTRD